MSLSNSQRPSDLRVPSCLHHVNVARQPGPIRAIFLHPLICDVSNDRAYGTWMSAVRDQASIVDGGTPRSLVPGESVLTRGLCCIRLHRLCQCEIRIVIFYPHDKGAVRGNAKPSKRAYSGNRAHHDGFKPLHTRSSGRIARHSAIRLHQVS